MEKRVQQQGDRFAWVRAIMGRNYFGPEDWIEYFNIYMAIGAIHKIPKFPKIPEFPWSPDVLTSSCPFTPGEKIANTHFAFLGLPKIHRTLLTIMRWHRFPRIGPAMFYHWRNPWYKDEAFANTVTCEFRWYLMPLHMVRGSERKSYSEQLTMLPMEYEVPTAIEELTKLLLYLRKSGQYVNVDKMARCKDTTYDGIRVQVGNFCTHGVTIMYYPDDLRYDYDGIAASRKPYF